MANIVVNLTEARLNDSPCYEALSYSWATEDGDAESNCAILCNGRRFMVTKNCDAALRRLRQPMKHVILWVDSICIDQSSTTEKNVQVALMADIYRVASKVRIWLGEASDLIDSSTGKAVSTVFLEYTTLIANEMRLLKESGKAEATLSLFCRTRSELASAVRTNEQTPFTEGLWHIESRRWWKRVWVVQEALLARSAIIICGDGEALYSDLYSWITFALMRSYSDSRQIFRRLEFIGGHMLINQAIRPHEIMRNRLPTHEPLGAVGQLLSQSRCLHATDNRDHIFAMLGLLDNLRVKLPAPDYNLQVADVYIQTMRSLIEHSNSLAILSETDYQSHSLGLPSWVVDWSKTPFQVLQGRIRYTYHATGESRSSYRFLNYHRVLMVTGKIISSINYLPKAANNSAYKFPYDMREATAGMKKSMDVAIAAQRLDESINDEVIWRTLCWDMDEKFTHPAPAATGKQFRMFRDIFHAETEAEDITRRLTREAYYFCQRYIHSMCLCITQEGMIASVPWNAEEGDILALIGGVGTPFVLRSAGCRYHLIGNCFLYGAMNGEAWSSDVHELQRLELS